MNNKLTRRAFACRVASLACGAVLSSVAEATLPSEKGTKHTVEKGETVWAIAQKYGVTPEEIIQINNLENPDKISPGQVLLIPGRGESASGTRATASEGRGEYIVRKGDTVWGIAQRFNTDPNEIIRINKLAKPYRIHPGDVLTIPGLVSAESRQQGIAWLCRLPRGVRPRNWRYIVIHHSATSVGNAAIFNRVHTQNRRMKNGLAYHFVIGNGHGSGDGEIEVGGRWTRQLQGGHVRSARINQIGIGICLVGDFQRNYPTTRQMESLVYLVRYLMKKYGIPERRVVRHRDMNSTTCPGKNFSIVQFRRKL